MRIVPIIAAAVLASGCATGGGAPEAVPPARADLVDRDGLRIGEVRLTQTPANGVLLQVEVQGLQPGVHAIHIHETGVCEPPALTSAGGHYAPRGHAHGALHPQGKHAGDLENFHVQANGLVRVDRLASGVTLREGGTGTLFDADGSAVVIHAGADDYSSQPSGAAGDRVACGVVRR